MLEITNLTQTKIDTNFLSKAAQTAFAVLFDLHSLGEGGTARRSPALPAGRLGEGGGEKNAISLVFVDDKKIREINKKYRGKNKVTNVLSFEDLDEIFICLPQAKRQAQLLKTSLKLELMRLLVHGIVHLKGYDHERGAKQAARMLAVENKILKKP